MGSVASETFEVGFKPRKIFKKILIMVYLWINIRASWYNVRVISSMSILFTTSYIGMDKERDRNPI